MQYSRFLLTFILMVLAGFEAPLLASEQAPTLRLPETVSPVSYQARLRLDPRKETFTGSIKIKAEVKQAVRTLWLNAAGMTFQNAAISTQGKTRKARPVAGGEDFMGLEVEEQLAPGPIEIAIEYTGHIRGQDSSGIFHMQDNGRDYLFTQFESTDARAAFPCCGGPGGGGPGRRTLE